MRLSISSSLEWLCTESSGREEKLNNEFTWRLPNVQLQLPCSIKQQSGWESKKHSGGAAVLKIALLRRPGRRGGWPIDGSAWWDHAERTMSIIQKPSAHR